jgi:hypothetical protein
MECVAALSTLKYKEFDLTDDFVSFRQIIHTAMGYTGYSDVILTDSVRSKSGKFIDLKIASANFYDELGDAMTYYEVLEEIAKFAGCCFTPYKEALYFLDYAAIRSGYFSYFTLRGGLLDLSDLKNVTYYKGTGTNISRIAGKNKAVVNCSLYEIENILPEWSNKNTIVRYEDAYGRLITKKDVLYWTIMRFYFSPEYTFYQYKWVDGIKTVTETHEPITDGGITSKNYSSTRNQILGGCFVRSVSYTGGKPNKLNLDNELMIKMGGHPSDTSQRLTDTDPIVRIESKQSVVLTDKTYLCFSGDYKMNYARDDDGGMAGSGEDYNGIADPIPHYPNPVNHDSISGIKLRLRVGNYYYDGTNWITAPSTFYATYTFAKKENMCGVYKGVDDTNDYSLGVGDLSGFIINPPAGIIIGKCTLTIYSPTHALFHRYDYMRGIGLSYAIQDMDSIYGDWVDKDSKNDLIYENVIDGEYIEEADEIDLRICTNPGGKLALSSVIDGGNFLDEIVTDVFGTGQAENILIQRVTQTFDQPRFVIDPVLANDAKPYTKFTEPHLNKQFLVAGGEEDVKMERTKYNLIEL